MISRLGALDYNSAKKTPATGREKFSPSAAYKRSTLESALLLQGAVSSGLVRLESSYKLCKHAFFVVKLREASACSCAFQARPVFSIHNRTQELHTELDALAPNLTSTVGFKSTCVPLLTLGISRWLPTSRKCAHIASLICVMPSIKRG